jgi:hypothetical protein
LVSPRVDLQLFLDFTGARNTLGAQVFADFRRTVQLRELAILDAQLIELRGRRLGSLTPPPDVILRQPRLTVRAHRSRTDP